MASCLLVGVYVRISVGEGVLVGGKGEYSHRDYGEGIIWERDISVEGGDFHGLEGRVYARRAQNAPLKRYRTKISHLHQLLQVDPLIVRDMAETIPELRQSVFRNHDELGSRVLI